MKKKKIAVGDLLKFILNTDKTKMAIDMGKISILCAVSNLSAIPFVRQGRRLVIR